MICNYASRRSDYCAPVFVQEPVAVDNSWPIKRGVSAEKSIIEVLRNCLCIPIPRGSSGQPMCKEIYFLPREYILAK